MIKKRLMKITNIELQKRERIMIVISMALSFFAFFTYWYLPQMKKLETTKSMIETIKQTESESQREFQALQIKAAIINQNKKQTATSVKLEPMSSNNKISALLESIVNGASGEVFTLNKIKLTRSTVENKIRTSYFAIELKSSFMGLSKFLDQLEKEAEWLTIEGVLLNRIEQDLRQCEGIITVITYEILGDES